MSSFQSSSALSLSSAGFESPRPNKAAVGNKLLNAPIKANLFYEMEQNNNAGNLFVDVSDYMIQKETHESAEVSTFSF